MGAACGKGSRKKNKSNNSSPYTLAVENKGGDSKENKSDNKSKPANTLNYDKPSPNRPYLQQIEKKEADDQGNSEKWKEEGLDLGNREKDFISNENLVKLSTKGKVNLPNLDQAQSKQPKVTQNEPVEKPRPSNYYTNQSYINTSMGGLDDYGKPINPNTTFEIIHSEKILENEDFYLEFNETQYKSCEEFLENKPHKALEHLASGPSTGPNKIQSNLMEWTKALQKIFNQEKSGMNTNEGKNKIYKAYKAILNLKERSWYEEMTYLYKEKNFMNKTVGQVGGLTFDRKLVQLEEQFRWFVSAVANVKLNYNSIIGAHEFPPFRISGRSKRQTERFESSNTSFAESDIIADLQSPGKSPFQLNPLPKKTQQFNFKQDPNDPRANLVYELPDIYSPLWHLGFVWKGVYFKLYSKRNAKQLKKEIKALKHIAIEYLQAETSIKLSDSIPHFGEQVDKSQGIVLNVILPLMTLVESSSWVLFGTPIFPLKKTGGDDVSNKLAQEGCNMFKNTLLLSTLTPKNFRAFYKHEDPTLNPISPTSAGSGYNQFIMIHNVAKNVIPLPKVDMMFVINQDPNAQITYLDYPRRGMIDVELVKKALGYSKYDIGINVLVRKDPRLENKTMIYDIIKFKRRGWQIQMVYVSSSQPLPTSFVRNKRAMEILSHSNSKRNIEIKGNVLVFATLHNRDTLIHPYFISDQVINQSFADEALDPMDLNKTNTKAKPNKESFVNTSLKASFKFNKLSKDEKLFQEYFHSNLAKSIDAIVDQIENTDNIINFTSLKELFHRKGVNMRLEWIVYARLHRERTKALVGCDILARCIKKMLDDKTSKKFKIYVKQSSLSYFEASAMKEKYDEMVNEASDFLVENLYKKLLCQYMNILIKAYTESPNEEEPFYSELQSELFFHRMRVFEMAKKILDPTSLDNFLSGDIISHIINLPCLNANVFMDAIQYHMNCCISYEPLRQIRTDKYIHWFANYGTPFQPSDFNFIFSSDSYLTIRERCSVLLLKFLSNRSKGPSTTTPIEFVLPAALYKLRKSVFNTESQGNGFECVLADYYELPELETLNDWIVTLEGVLNGLYSPDGQQNFLIESYIIQLVLAFFGESDTDNQLCLTILERINAFANNSPVCSPELMITLHTWFGILSENKLFLECEQSYCTALLILHKLYGDPRGRGAYGTPWELFITWRLSILSRLQSKLHDAEYAEELFDAVAMTLRDNPMNQYLKSHSIYTDPFKEFYSNAYSKTQNHLHHTRFKPSFKTMTLNDHPFPYWTHHLLYDENTSKIDTINSTLQRSPQLLKWMITHMPILHNTGIVWETSYLRDFFLSIMQSSFSNTTSVSSISGLSLDGKRERSAALDGTSTPKGSVLKFDKKEKRFNQGGNLVQIFEKDASTVNKKDLNGVIYSWGQNTDGQVGSPISNVDDIDPGLKKMKIYYPRCILPIKDTIIVSVSCGHTHSMAITITRKLLAWGSNKSMQLGLGNNAPTQVFIPTLVPDIDEVQQVSCGTEHTVALACDGNVYSWGTGEGGVLGHGDLLNQSSPKVINALRGLDITSVECGGLHTLVLTRQGHVYAWGRGEGGQLGIPFEQLTHNPSTNELYLMIPKRVRSSIEGVNIIQIACGDAHSLALSQHGVVYGWGYTNSGQLGLGITGDTYTPSSKYSIQVKEPTVIEKLSHAKITEIFAGSTFSLFLNDKQELYGCGLNDYNQLGIEKTVTKITNIDNFRQSSSSKTNECAIPKKIDCFTSLPILKVACGENHSLAVVLYDTHCILFAWGMHRHAQLGIGDIQANFSTPRPISYLQCVIKSMACGAYHSLVVLGEPKHLKKEALIERLTRKLKSKWNVIFFEAKDNYEGMIETAINNLDNIIPSEEGKIDNPKAINKGN